MSVPLGSLFPIFIRRATVRFTTPTVTSMTAMAEKMKANKDDANQHPDPVLRQPSHASLLTVSYSPTRRPQQQ